MKRRLLHRVSDVSKEEQTDELKVQLYKLIKQFVFAGWSRYYPHSYGDKDLLDDLVMEFYDEFTTEKGRGAEKESLLDKWDPEKLTLPALVKVCVNRKLIDKERSHVPTIRMTEEYDEDSGLLSLDYVLEHLAEDTDEYVDLELTDEVKEALTEKFESLSESQKAHVSRLFSRLKSKIDSDYVDFFSGLLSKKSSPESNSLVSEINNKFDVKAQEKAIRAGDTICIKAEDVSEDLKTFLESKGYVWLKNYRANSYFIKK